MAGNRAVENGDFVTPRAEYREVTSADLEGPEDLSIPVIDTRYAHVSPAAANVHTLYGRDATIFLAALLEGVSSAKLELWLFAEVEKQELINSDPRDTFEPRPKPGGLPSASSSSSSSSSSSAVLSEWVKAADDVTLTVSKLVKFNGIPPGRYKVVVSALTFSGGSGTVYLREQHAA